MLSQPFPPNKDFRLQRESCNEVVATRWKYGKPRSESAHVNVDVVVENYGTATLSRIYSLEWIRHLRSLSSVINLENVNTPSRDDEQ